MRRYILTTLVVIGAGAVAAPAASAQTTAAIVASYNVKVAGPNGSNPSCPGNEAVCGSGIDPTFGAFTLGQVFDFATGVATTTLTFATGVLVIDETFQARPTPGNSGSPHPGFDHGHPGTALFTWTVDSSSSGVFLNATGGGTDVGAGAGEQGKGVISGTLTLQ